MGLDTTFNSINNIFFFNFTNLKIFSKITFDHFEMVTLNLNESENKK